MKRTTRQLRDSSIDAFVLAIETINRPSVAYRIQAFCILYTNAWELLLKAKLVHHGEGIHLPKKRHQERETISLDSAIRRTWGDPNNPMRANIERVAELRNRCAHMVLAFVPPAVMGIFQAGVVNYANCLREWFKVDLADRVPLGLMSLVFDVDPAKYSIDAPQVRKALGVEAARWLTSFQHAVNEQRNAFEQDKNQFAIPMNLHLALVRNPANADLVFSSISTEGVAETNTLILSVPKDSDKTHPYRQKEVRDKLRELFGQEVVNNYDLSSVNVAHDVRQRPEFYYKSKFATGQYSQAFIDWIVKRYKANPGFFTSARTKRRQSELAARKAA